MIDSIDQGTARGGDKEKKTSDPDTSRPKPVQSSFLAKLPRFENSRNVEMKVRNVARNDYLPTFSSARASRKKLKSASREEENSPTLPLVTISSMVRKPLSLANPSWL